LLVLLNIEELSVTIGGNHIVKQVDLVIEERQVVGLIGPNGAGKSTILNSISGFMPHRGRKFWRGEPFPVGVKLSSLGISRTFQHPQLAPDLTLLDNIRLGLYSHSQHGWLEAIVRGRRFQRNESESSERALNIAKACNIERWLSAHPTEVPYGVQKLTELARALVSKPLLILLDEPAAGLNNNEKMVMRDILRNFSSSHEVSMLIVDHDMQFIFDLCEKLYAINFGQLIAAGDPDSIRQNQAVQEAYFGEQYVAEEG
jgi:branched-chain amino acid transport system ATP-binding protein